MDTEKFNNDLRDIQSRDDALTALIHLGYLSYDQETGEAFVPNEEVRKSLAMSIEGGKWSEAAEALKRSRELLKRTWDMDAEAVAKEIDASHMDFASIIAYNDENALASAIMLSYYTAREKYTIVRELPSGKGYADIAFVPRPHANVPAMIVELKWNRKAESAIKQIKDRNYAGALKNYGEILLVGISYNKRYKKHKCLIEKWEG